MFCQVRMSKRTSDSDFPDGYALMEIMIAITVAMVSLLGAYALVLSIGRNYRDSSAMTDMYADSRIAVERLFRDLSETSNSTVMVRTTGIRTEDGIRDDAISFASARDENGIFQLGTYGSFNFVRPIHQKAIVYYLLHDTGEAPPDTPPGGPPNGGVTENPPPAAGVYGSKKLYRKEIPKTDWDTNYDPMWAMDENGELIAQNVDYMYFALPYPVVDPEVTRQDHVLDVSIGFLKDVDEMEAGPARTVKINTGIPMMNRDKR